MYENHETQAAASTDLVTIAVSDLGAVNGGKRDPGVEFMNQGVENSKMTMGHAGAAWNAATKGDVGTAVYEGGAAGYDFLHSVVDGAKHAEGLWNFTKDAVDTASKIVSMKKP